MMDGLCCPKMQQHFPLYVFCLSNLKRLHFFQDATHLIDEACSFHPQSLFSTVSMQKVQEDAEYTSQIQLCWTEFRDQN